VCEHVFVSETRDAIAALIERGLGLNEIAHRLGLANSTVGYHARALREDGPDRARRREHRTGGRAPVAPPTVTRERVRELVERGDSRATIAETLGIACSTVTYHATQLGADIDRRFGQRYDWSQIREFYGEGNSVAACDAAFGFNRGRGTRP
jgi:DNA-binding NarL/FixJ family response regulator